MWYMESVLEHKLHWSSVVILKFLSSLLVTITLCRILNKNCLSLLSLVGWYIFVNLHLQSGKNENISFQFLIPVGSVTEQSLNSL